MVSRIFWVPEVEPLKLAFMPRPQGADGLEQEVQAWKESGITTVVSLLESSEASFLGLQEEEAQCKQKGIDFLTYPIGDRGLPRDVQSVRMFAEGLVGRLQKGEAVAIHCRVGIGRSGLMTACVLLHLGIPYPQVFPSLVKVRGVDVPDTVEQKHWVEMYAQTIV